MFKQNMRRLKSYLLTSLFGRIFSEMCTHIFRLRQSRESPRVVFMPSQNKSMGSSMLRVYYLAPELRKLGWRTTIIPPHLSLTQRKRIIKLENPNVCVIQKCRHPDNSPALYPSVPVVFDIDDVDYIDPRLRQKHIDCVTSSAAVSVGSNVVAEWCRQYNRNVHVVWTGTPVPKKSSRNLYRLPSDRAPIITWASSFPAGCPDEMKFIRLLLLKLAETNKFEFWLFGKTDSDFLDSELYLISSAGIPVKTFSHLKYKDFICSLENVAIGYQPISDSEYSQGKSFGKILAYLLANVPIITTNSLEHPFFFSNKKNGFLANNLDEWVRYSKLLLDNPELRNLITENAFYSLNEQLTSSAAAKKMHIILRSAMS